MEVPKVPISKANELMVPGCTPAAVSSAAVNKI